jgi:hypothetical protein
MTKSELKALMKESLKELLFDSKILETLMVEVVSRVDQLRENTGMSAGAVEGVPSRRLVGEDEVDLDIEEESEAPEEKLAENIASFWGRQLAADPEFSSVKIAARGKDYIPTEFEQKRAKDDPVMSNLRKAASLKIGGVEVFDKSNFVEEESNVSLDENSFLGRVLNSKKVRENIERSVE